MIYVLLVLGTLAFVLLLLPVLAPARQDTGDTRRTELEEERELLLAGLGELGAGEPGAADAGTLTREKVRLAQVLHELDHLPPAPAPGRARPALPWAVGTLLGVAALLLVGSLTFFPSWRAVGLSPNERTQLASAAKLPELERAATRSGAVTDYAAWGSAAWDAGQFQTAAKAYTQVLLKERDNPEALRRVGYFLLSDRNMAQDGLGFIARSVQADPQSPEGQLLYGYGLGLFGEYARGLEVLDTYKKLAPTATDADELIVEYQAKVGGAVDGRLVYAQNCAACHGPAGQGGTGPKIVGSPTLRSEAALRAIILGGAAGMPAFPQLEGKQLDALVKTLQGPEWR